jgi:hypothetical protein
MSRYVFNPEELQEAAALGRGHPMGRRWDLIYDDLRLRHPDHLPRGYRWTFNTAGNVVCQIALIYASPVEYVAFFGTPLGATGFSGRYPWADVWDLMVDGTMRTFIPGQFEPTVYGPGDSAYLPRGMGKGVQYEAHTWMIDYARGLPVTMLPSACPPVCSGGSPRRESGRPARRRGNAHRRRARARRSAPSAVPAWPACVPSCVLRTG